MCHYLSKDSIYFTSPKPLYFLSLTNGNRFQVDLTCAVDIRIYVK
jgi:hypothetical protein